MTTGEGTREVPPRIYCLPAAKAPIVAVFRRGPTNWSGVGLWDLAKGRYEQGAWLGGRLFARRSDVSPDGRLLCYFAHKPSATWEPGEAYVALSKLPWLTALHAFRTCGTWTRGYYFSEDDQSDGRDEVKLPIPYGLRSIPPVQFANERRRGWEEAPDSPTRDPRDVWDQHRHARMQKRQPGGRRLLCVEGRGWTGDEPGAGQAVHGMHVQYWLGVDGGLEPLDHLQWADWDREGRLLVATRSGKLQVWNLEGRPPGVLFDEDLSLREPNPVPAPDWARRW